MGLIGLVEKNEQLQSQDSPNGIETEGALSQNLFSDSSQDTQFAEFDHDTDPTHERSCQHKLMWPNSHI